MALYDHSHHPRPRVDPAQSVLCGATCVAGLVIVALGLQWLFGLIL